MNYYYYYQDVIGGEVDTASVNKLVSLTTESDIRQKVGSVLAPKYEHNYFCTIIVACLFFRARRKKDATQKLQLDLTVCQLLVSLTQSQCCGQWPTPS